MPRKVVYVAGPYTHGDRSDNVRNAIAAGMRLLDAGYAPVVPILSHFADLIHPRPYEDWLQADLAILSKCDAMVRLSGFSPGSKRELQEAMVLGIPVYWGSDPVGDFLLQDAGTPASRGIASRPQELA